MVLQQRILQQSFALPKRTSKPDKAVIHIPGASYVKKAFDLAVQLDGNSKPLPSAVDEAGLLYYKTSGTKFFGQYVVGWGGVYQMAPDDRVCWHSAKLGDHYKTDAWRLLAKPVGSTSLQKHGRDPKKVWDWWDARWPGVKSPAEFWGQSINSQSIGIDVVAQRDGTFSPYTMSLLLNLLDYLKANKGLVLAQTHVKGHEDVDPCARGTRKRDGRILGIPWDPGTKFAWSVLNLPKCLT